MWYFPHQLINYLLCVNLFPPGDITAKKRDTKMKQDRLTSQAYYSSLPAGNSKFYAMRIYSCMQRWLKYFLSPCSRKTQRPGQQCLQFNYLSYGTIFGSMFLVSCASTQANTGLDDEQHYLTAIT